MSPARPAALAAIAGNPGAAALLLDFDGVLSPIVRDPQASVLPPDAARALGRLSRSLGLVAVVSGRPLGFIAERVRVPGVVLLGSYGIEQDRNGERWLDPEARPWLAKVDEARAALDGLFRRERGIYVEEKPVSVAVHWRNAPDPARAAQRVRAATADIARQTGLRVEPGKSVAELRPPVAADKGAAVASLVKEPSLATVAYAGDDLGDVPALRAVRERNGYALVVTHGAETDPLLRRLADEEFPGTAAFAAWLAELADAVG